MTNKQQQRFKEINVVIGFIVLLMMLLPALILKDTETSYTGLEIGFGQEFASLGSWASGEIAFNPLVLLAFVLPFVGSLIPMVMTKGFIISTIMFIASIILLVMIPQLTTVTVTLLNTVTEIDVEWTMGLGPILAALFSIIGAGLGMFSIFKRH
jgi:hypothetical protein